MQPIITSLEEIESQYEGFIIDIWGVVHDGHAIFPGVINALKKLKNNGKKIVFLSNAPRRHYKVIEQLAEKGLSSDLYDGLYSSGDAVYDALQLKQGQSLLHLGLKAHLHLYEDLDILVVDNIEDAHFILNSGPEAVNNPEALKDMFVKAIGQSIPMLCANPDIEVMVGGQRYLCAGAFAKYFEDLSGIVDYYGKPHPYVYDEVINMLGLDRKKILCIGDNLHTDILGGMRNGIDSALVVSGIHSGELMAKYGENPNPQAVERLCSVHGIYPTYVLPGLQ